MDCMSGWEEDKGIASANGNREFRVWAMGCEAVHLGREPGHCDIVDRLHMERSKVCISKGAQCTELA